ncbi:MAG: YtxH domain-containing protein [Anaerolineae bacterium]
MNRVVRVMAGMLLGAALAAGLVLLFAPQSGAEVRQKIKDRVDDILAEGRQAAEERRLELTAQFESLKQPISES